MKAVVLKSKGHVDNMVWEEIGTPSPRAANSVLIRVKAAGINRPDILQRQGLYDPPADASPILGLEVAGVVADAHGSSRWKVGDRVCALTHGGGYAEYVWVDDRHCLPIPQGWTFADAASLPETFFTVWFNVFMQGKLGKRAPEVLLVHGGASGIGVAATRIAKAMGQQVVVTVRREDQLKKCLSIGADGAFLLAGPWKDQIRASYGGVDVVLDFLGAATFEQNVDLLKPYGRILWLAFLTGAKVSLSIPAIMAKQLIVTGSFLRPQPPEVKAEIASELLEHVWPLLEQGTIQPVVHEVYSIQDVAKAHLKMEQGGFFGKIVLIVDSVDQETEAS